MEEILSPVDRAVQAALVAALQRGENDPAKLEAIEAEVRAAEETPREGGDNPEGASSEIPAPPDPPEPPP